MKIFPFQIFPPGSLQISDFLIIIGILFSLKKIIIEIYNNEYLKFLFVFCIYTFLLSIIIAIINQDAIFLKNPLNYFYCFIFIVFIKTIYKTGNFFKITVLGIFISFVLQFFVFKNTEINLEYTRYILKFNNPNQLGFWALNIFVILAIINYNFEFSLFWNILIKSSILFSIFFILISISQAAIASLALCLIFFIFLYLRKKIITLLLILVTILSFVFYNIDKFSEFSVVQNVVNRFSNETDNDDGDNDLEGRNYTRLVNFPEYLLFGSSEGLNNRFGTKDLNEIHSTFANLLFSYGLVGSLFFIIPYLYIIKTRNWFNITILFIYLIFTLAHSTLRWPLFWLIPMFILIINKKNQSCVWDKWNSFKTA